MSVKRICEVIMRDEKSILPVSHVMHGVYDIDAVSLSMPRDCRGKWSRIRYSIEFKWGGSIETEGISGCFEEDYRFYRIIKLG